MHANTAYEEDHFYRWPFFRVAADANDEHLVAHINTLQPRLLICDDKAQERMQLLGLLPSAGPAAQITVAHGVCSIYLLPHGTAMSQDGNCHGSSSSDSWTQAVSLEAPPKAQMALATSTPLSCATLSSSAAENFTPLCVVATSGSSGQPKYVTLSHESVIHRMQWQQHMFPLTGDDVVMIKASPTFVDSLWETLAPAVFGVCPLYTSASPGKPPEASDS